MTSAFILKLDVGDDTDLVGIAADLADIITADGRYLVIESTPWAHPTLAPSGLTPPGAPVNTIQ